MSNRDFLREIAFNASLYSKEKEYWLNKLSGRFVRSSFPYDFNKMEEGQRNEIGHPVEHREFKISGGVFEKLMWTANNSDLRLFMILVAGLTVILGKHTGQEDILVGAPIERQEVDGNFLNTILALRVQLDAGITFKELLLQVRQVVVEAGENQNFPIEQIPYELNMEIQKNDAFALFDTAILLENLHDKSYITHIPLNMVFSFLRTSESIEGVVEYNPALYKKETVQGIIGHFVHLFQETVSDIDIPIVNLDIMTESERQFLLVKMNNTRSEYPNLTIHELFESQVEKTPGNIAVEETDTGRTLTFKELNRRANQLAALQVEKEVKPGMIVAVIGERTYDIITSILAILKAGGVFLPLDAQNPDERLQFILKDSGASIFISQKRISAERERLFKNFSPGNIIVMDDHSIYKGDTGNTRTGIQPSNPAYIIYTSGTTGKPKGVMVEHKSLVNYIHFAVANYVKGEAVNLPLYTSIAFDLTITSIFTPLVTGNTVVVYSGWNKGNLIERIIDDNKIGVMKLTPSHLYLIGEKKVADLLHKIKRFVVGGEILKFQIARKISDNFNGKVEIYNEYGPTEATVGCMLYKFDPVKDQGKGASVSIGVPATNAQIYLLDKNRKPVPMGAVGEIYIGGDGLARGYLNHPELTAERFISFHHSSFIIHHSKLYRTGDLARWMPDGNIEFLDRIDHQVKIRGFRIELEEIESQLLTHEAVKEAVVTIKEAAGRNAYGYKTGDSRICAYIVSGAGFSASELREYLAGKLPDYMIPSYFVRLDEIPLTPNGKVDMRALPEPGIKAEAEYVPPRDEREKKLVGIWSKILGLDPGIIGVDSNFFELGGHSLSGTVLTTKIHKAFDVKLALADLFRLPTVRELAPYLEKSGKIKFTPIEPVEEKEHYPLSSAQERLFVLQQLDTGGIGYNVPLTFKIEGDFSLEKIHNVFLELIRRHENFRTSFVLIDDKPVQKIHKNVEFEIDYFDVTGVESSPLRDSENRSIINRFIRPFDFSRAPLLRVGLIRTDRSNHHYIMMMDIHHIITDGVSMDILLKEIEALYTGNRLSPVKLRYRDFSEWQNCEKVKMEMKKQEAYWLKQFEGEIPVLELPIDFPRPAFQNFEGDRIQFTLDNREVKRLRELAAEQDVTLFMVIFSLYNIFLSKVSGQEDIVTGTPIAGRRHTDLEYIMGIFINTLALRNYPDGKKSFLEFLHEIKISTLDAYENQEYQYEDLVTQVAVRRDTSRDPLVDTIVALNNVDTQFLDIPKFKIPDLKIIPYKSDFLIAKVDILLNALDIKENVSFVLEYSTKLFKEETIRRFIGYFRQVVTGVLANPMQKISEIEILSEEEKNKILYDFNDTVTEYPVGSSIHRLFEEQVGRTPNSIAAVGPSTETTHVAPLHIAYNELDEKSNLLACVLREKGVEPGTIVGIMTERSVEMIIGLLGILKVGGAYLPIDPDYPLKRIKYVVEDSGAKVVITTSLFSKEVERLSSEKDGTNFTIIYLDTPGYFNSSFSSSLRLSPSYLAYVIYTSGSTGRPRGVMVEHRNVLRLVKNSNFIHFLPLDRSLPTGSSAFDITTFEIWGPLCNAVMLLLVSKDVILNAGKLKEVLVNYDISILHLIPQLFDTLAARDIELFAGLRYLLVGGDLVRPGPVNRLRERYSHLKILHMYGPTENTTFSTFFPVKGNYEYYIPIGTPVRNTSVFIFDKYGHLQPVGIIGELCVGGEGLARGYLNNPEQTAEKFIVDSRLSIRNLYRTGDLARWLPDGNIQFLGRMDEQVKIRGFRIELGEIQFKLSRYNEVSNAVVRVKEDGNGNKNLCAYIVSNREFNVSELREYLSREVPDYMIPSYFVKLGKIPVTPNGKIDYKVLPDPEGLNPGDDAAYIPPTNPVEKKLVEIWEKVLGRINIGINENFFRIGGDSIKSIQIISRMSSAGYMLEMKDLFKYPTISALAPRLKKSKHIPDQSIISGTIPLTPIQRAFFNESHRSPHHYNQAVLLYSKEGVDKEAIKEVFSRIQEHHDALRHIYHGNTGSGEVVQIGHGLEYPLSVQEFDLKNHENDLEELKTKINEIQTSFDLEKGPLMKLGLFHLNDGDRLLIAVHHLVIDGVSWRILFEDIETLYNQYKRGEKLVLPSKTDPFKSWSDKLSAYADSKIFMKEITYWQKIESVEVFPITKDFDVDENYFKDTGSVSFTLRETETERLLTKVNEIFRTEINDILLTALGMGIKKTFGQDRVLITLEGHGREEIPEEIDISRTVGWFTSAYPVVLDVSHAGDPGCRIKEIKETLRRIPNKGMGYGILKYLTGEENKKDIQFKLKPQISFNYLGQFDAEVMQISSFEIAKESAGDSQSPYNRREYLLDVSGMTSNNRLTMTISFNKTHFKPETIAALAGNFEVELRHLIAFCCSKKNKELTPSDFTYKGLSIERIDRLMEEYPDIEDIYTLTPMQEGLLFHALADDSSYSYFEQTSYRLQGELDICLLEKSLNELFKRHDTLRTAFVYKDIERPVQLVLRDRVIDFYYEDISKLEERERKENFIKDFKKRDRERSFDLSRGTLMRVSIHRLEESEYEFTWSSHHILMDGWSRGILYKELTQVYRALRNREPLRLETVVPYSDYIKWLEQVDKTAGLKYWEEYLDGYEHQASLPQLGDQQEDGTDDSYELAESFFFPAESLVEGLNKIALDNTVTPSAVFQTLWAILLQRYNNIDDVVFGTPVSGRSTKIQGVENTVGLFINTIPVRIRVKDPTMPFSQLLAAVQQESLVSNMHDYIPLAEIQGRPLLGRNLIDHLFAFQNFPVADVLKDAASQQVLGFTIEDVENYEQAHYDFSVVISPIYPFSIRFSFNSLVYDRNYIQQVAQHFLEIMNQVTTQPDIRIADIEILLEEEKKQQLVQLNNTRTEYPMDKTIHRLFEEQVEKSPDRLSVLEGDRQFTYRQLNENADRLARLLRTKGVGRDSTVGIMVERSAAMVTGILGILKAGGAYCSIDFESPRQRIVSLLNDCSAGILLTNTQAMGSHSFSILQGLNDVRVTPYCTPMRPQILDLDNMPVTDRSLVNYDRYNRYLGEAMVTHCLSIQGTRGCPYNCSYCHKIWPKRHVVRSAEHIIAEIRSYYDMGVRRFSLIDDIFNLDVENSSRFFNLIIDNGLDIHLFFPNGLRGDLLTEEYIDLMVRAGTASIALALETASPRLQKLLRKNLNIEKLRENAEYICREHPGVILELYTMHGFPTETEAEAMKTLDFVKNLKWLHFAHLNLLKIFPNTEMAQIAIENGVSREAILESDNLAFHELPATLPFDKNFTRMYQADYLNHYFLSKERLLSVLPRQMLILTEEEMVKKYNTYLPDQGKTFADLLHILGISPGELGENKCLPEEKVYVPDIHVRMKNHFPRHEPAEGALRILLLDLSQAFSREGHQLNDLVEPPLGLMSLLTYLNRQYGGKINGRIGKALIDFDNYAELKRLLETFQPDLVGIRTLSYYKDFFHRTVAKIREWGVTVPIITGGPYATSGYETILQDRHVDLVVMGEGEVTFSQLIGKVLENGGRFPAEEELKKIAGLAFVPQEVKHSRLLGREIIMMDELTGFPSKYPFGPLNMNVNRGGTFGSSRDLAYSIFTSGSTGTPKGVMVEHRSVVRLVKNTGYVEFTGTDKVLQTGALEFDASTFEIWGPLLNGGALCLVSKDRVLAPEQLKKSITVHAVTTMWMSSPLFNQMLDVDIEIFNGLKTLVVGGDVLSPDRINRLRAWFPRLKIVNGYGPTENTTFSLTHPIDKDYHRNIPIGKPIANSTAYIVDRYNRLLPWGAAGELCVGGQGLSRGYMNNPDFTRERFIMNPFAKGELLYKTGDLARFLLCGDGSVEFLGRIDHQVKIRGFRIELGEIENHLLKHEKIKQAVVTIKKNGQKGSGSNNESSDKQICAYIVTRGDGGDVTGSELKTYLLKRLPDYMIPVYFVRLAQIPLNARGKIDRDALPDPELDTGSGYSAPRDNIEREMVNIWSGVLGVEKEKISINNDFFQLGGHSLKATMLIDKIHKAFDVSVPVKEVFTAPTVEELAAYVTRAVEHKHTSLVPAEEKQYYLLSPAQKRLYAMQHIASDSRAYNTPQAFILDGALEKDRLENALQKLIQKHDVFRTSFELVDGIPFQRIFPAVNFAVEYYRLPEDRLEEALGSFCRPFDFTRPPLMRVGLIQAAETRHILMIDVHHIITDGISQRIVIDEFMALYDGVELSPSTYRYRDYSEWQNSPAKRNSLKKQEVYWLDRFAGEIPVLQLPIDFEKPGMQSFEGKYVSFVIPKEQVYRLKELSRETRATLYMILLAVDNVLLARYSRQEDIVVGSPVTGRRHTDLQDIVGMFVNMLAMRNRCSPGKTFREFLLEVKVNSLDAFENQEFPFNELVTKLGLSGDLSRNPLFNVVFEMYNIAPENKYGSSTNFRRHLKITQYNPDAKTSVFDLILAAVENGDTIDMRLSYPVKLFKTETAETMTKHYIEILEQVTENPDILLKEIAISHRLLKVQSKHLPNAEEDFGF